MRFAYRFLLAGGREHINALVATYLKAIKTKQQARAEGRQLYDVLLRPIPEAAQKETLVVVRDATAPSRALRGICR